MSSDKAAEARKGLLDTVAGKAREVAGAVTGNDALVEEGQLQQAGARDRKEAASRDAIADAERAEATVDLNRANLEAGRTKHAAAAAAESQEAVVEAEADAEHQAAQAEIARQEQADRERAEQSAADLAEARLHSAEAVEDAADDTEDRAAAEARRLHAEAADAEAQAARLRDDAETTTTNEA